MATIENLTQRAEFAKRFIKDVLKDTGLCIYGVNKETNEIYLADRQEVYDGVAQIAIALKLDNLNDLF